MVSRFAVIELPTFIDPRGALTVVDELLPFKVVRTYWIYGANGQTRGGHRHFHTRQVLIALTGVVSIYMNDGVADETIILDRPNQALIVEPKDWHSMTFDQDAILLVFASHLYDLNEYIDARYE
jgi:hypothetical protein